MGLSGPGLRGPGRRGEERLDRQGEALLVVGEEEEEEEEEEHRLARARRGKHFVWTSPTVWHLPLGPMPDLQ